MCGNNELTSLKGAPKIVSKRFDCAFNRNLTSLEGAPKIVNGSFSCCHCSLSNLKHAPQKVNDFDCSHNTLTSLEGVPERINGEFDCSANKLTSLKYFPKLITGDVFIYDNSKQFTEEEIRAVSDVKGKIRVIDTRYRPVRRPRAL
jgi:Leucine-rich repeat (LRR) protein